MYCFRLVGICGVLLVASVDRCVIAEASEDNSEGLVNLLERNTMDKTPNKEPVPVVIPLSEIWAYNMPGTRDIRELQADKIPVSGDGPLVEQIRRSLSKDRPKGKAAGKGFAVLGTGLEALREAHTVLVEGRKPRNSFPGGSKISLVFFSHLSSCYVHLHQVNRQRTTITIRYQFVPHETKEMTTHIALIPIKGLLEDEYRIHVTQSPMERKFVESGFKQIDAAQARSIACGPFSFQLNDITRD